MLWLALINLFYFIFVNPFTPLTAFFSIGELVKFWCQNSVFISHIVLFVLIKFCLVVLLILSPCTMHRNQKRCLCGHVAAVWDTHVEACRSCCGCSKDAPCVISKTWSPSTWEKMAAARLHSSRRGKASGSGKREASKAAATSQGPSTAVELP